MLPKLLTLIVLGAALGLGLLDLRQRRIQAMHEMATLHRQIDQARQATWRLQTQIIAASDPRQLKTAVAELGLALEPDAPGPLPAPGSQAWADRPGDAPPQAGQP